MLPGFRFLFAAIVLSMSILVFGLGAAALLRAAHEQFASTPTWRAGPDPTFAQQADFPRDVTRDVTRPVLAMLRVEPEPRSSDSAAAVNSAVSAEPAEAERIAALRPLPENSAPQAAGPDPAVEGQQPTEAAATPTEASAIADTAGVAPAAAETKVASTEPAPPPQVSPLQASPLQASPLQASPLQALPLQVLPLQALPPANDVVPVVSGPATSEPDIAPGATATDAASTRIATLGGPPVAIEPPPPVKAAVGAKPDREAIRKQRQARRAAQRRRLAARARAAARLAVQQPADPFGQQLAQPPATARKH